MKILRAIAIVLAVLIALLTSVAFGVRMADGPVAMFPGGPFKSGEWVDGPVSDWSFASGVEEIELESGETSRTTWILVEDGEAYIPCSLGVPPGKHWHTDALEKPDAVVRIDGKRYRRRLQKVEDDALQQRLFGVVEAKYGRGPAGGSGTWFFHLAPPF